MKALLVCSSGGHLTQLHQLRPWWGRHERTWVTFAHPQAESLLAGERVITAFSPTTRNIPNALRNLRLAIKVIRAERPDVIISDGAWPFRSSWWRGCCASAPSTWRSTTGFRARR